MTSWLDDIQHIDVVGVSEALGLELLGGHSLSLAPCPTCGAERRGSSDRRRGPIGLTRDRFGWRCFRCQAGGRALDLVAVHLGLEPPQRGDGESWARIQAWYAEQGWCDPPRSSPLSPLPIKRRPTPIARPHDPEPVRPPSREVQSLWDSCSSVTSDPGAIAWLNDRGLDAEKASCLDVVRVLPRGALLPAWACFGKQPWASSGHRIIIPMWGATGRLESLHARSIDPKAPGRYKAVSPRGCEIRGLVMADDITRSLLAGSSNSAWDRRIVISEGVPDWLTWATLWEESRVVRPAVLGVIAGSWCAQIASRIPRGSKVIIRTHADPAGDKYAEKIRQSLAGECTLLRARPGSHSDIE